MTDLPSPYNSLAEPLKAVILRTFIEKTVKNDNFGWDLGFHDFNNGATLEQLLDGMRDSGRLAVLERICARCLVVPGLWNGIRSITGIWTVPQGKDISEGFNFMCDNADRLKDLMEASTGSVVYATRMPNGRLSAQGGQKPKFCRDKPGFAAHGPRDCYREIVTAGPGLHVCITHKENRAELLHEIHIDVFQQACYAQANGECDYRYANVNSIRHMVGAAPWWIGEKLKEARGR